MQVAKWVAPLAGMVLIAWLVREFIADAVKEGIRRSRKHSGLGREE